MSDAAGRPGRSGFSNDQIVLVLLGVGAVVFAVAKRHVLLARLRGWLEAKRVSLPGQEALLSTPFGGFDLPRLLVGGGVVVVVLVTARLVLRRRRAAAGPL